MKHNLEHGPGVDSRYVTRKRCLRTCVSFSQETSFEEIDSKDMVCANSMPRAILPHRGLILSKSRDTGTSLLHELVRLSPLVSPSTFGRYSWSVWSQGSAHYLVKLSFGQTAYQLLSARWIRSTECLLRYRGYAIEADSSCNPKPSASVSHDRQCQDKHCFIISS